MRVRVMRFSGSSYLSDCRARKLTQTYKSYILFTMSKSASTFLLIAVAAVFVVAGLLVGSWMLKGAYDLQAAQEYPAPRMLNEFRLERGNGSPFLLEDLQGQWSLMFFGFTNCPDVCPDTLALLATAMEELEPKTRAPLPQVVLVSVDPERDRGSAMDEYVRWFNPEFLAVTGEHDELERLTRQFGVIYYAESPDPESGFYNVDHTAVVLIVDPQGQVVGHFSQPLDIDALIADIFRLTS